MLMRGELKVYRASSDWRKEGKKRIAEDEAERNKSMLAK
jgi:hypothetical protein